MKRLFSRMFILVATLTTSVGAIAQWELDNDRSVLNFISIKNASIAETHSFKSLSGHIGKEGNAQLSIDLNSVETLIAARNERMQNMLFETAEFPTATITAQVAPKILEEVAAGGTAITEIPVNLSLHGLDATLRASVTVFGDQGSFRVVTTRPIILAAKDFGLEAGIGALQEVAGLANIATAVPVSFSLLFTSDS